ncbi:DUF2225 domain-containing protein [Paenibacillus doosanensis]|uniref:DUF2225 domain-containing protein n=1 Tax=Paenibacillus konkukensis TaxID=2020716 RepID=A0ABY4RPV8_9BACL|nr:MULTISPECIES: DUF2225 domain-containing protein [Paenibacillus]MCS7463524.1 DUF2225 domain-containing protein [Paenibacillus doosanensis]UQZ83392.1 hypothetical protein SK3146_02579 [Paenibacillus konkukensis]
MAVEPLFQVKIDCAYCETSFQTSRVRPSFKKATRTDTDFCVHYKDVNPDYYVVRVCPACGYAATENMSEQFSPAQRDMFQTKIAAQWTNKDYGLERNWDDAMQTYKLALVCAQLKNEKGRVIAGLLHHIAWLYRYKNDEEQERRFLQFALEAYTGVFETEGAELNNARLMYLLGELNRRLGRYHEAVQWFSRVVNDKRIMDSAMIRACREQWTATREEMLAERMEPPEELA